jgi:hypothetical protein
VEAKETGGGPALHYFVQRIFKESLKDVDKREVDTEAGEQRW